MLEQIEKFNALCSQLTSSDARLSKFETLRAEAAIDGIKIKLYENLVLGSGRTLRDALIVARATAKRLKISGVPL